MSIGQRSAAVLLGILLWGAQVLAQPIPGEPLPATGGHDLNGKPRWLNELYGERRTLIVVLTDRDAREEMDGWLTTGKELAPPDVNLVSLLSLGLPFFVGEGMARGEAKKEVPPEEWDMTLLDVDGHIAKELGLPRGLPWAIVIDGDGNVLAAVQGAPWSPEAEEIWDALEE